MGNQNKIPLYITYGLSTIIIGVIGYSGVGYVLSNTGIKGEISKIIKSTPSVSNVDPESFNLLSLSKVDYNLDCIDVYKVMYEYSGYHPNYQFFVYKNGEYCDNLGDPMYQYDINIINMINEIRNSSRNEDWYFKNNCVSCN